MNIYNILFEFELVDARFHFPYVENIDFHNFWDLSMTQLGLNTFLYIVCLCSQFRKCSDF